MTNKYHDVARTAYMAAAHALLISLPKADSEMWPACGGTLTAAARKSIIDDLFAFAHTQRGAPAEALYRYVVGKGIHDGSPDAWEALALPYRSAFEVYVKIVPTLADVADDQNARQANAERLTAARRPQVIDQDETILERGGSAMEKITDAPKKVTMRPSAQAAVYNKAKKATAQKRAAAQAQTRAAQAKAKAKAKQKGRR